MNTDEIVNDNTEVVEEVVEETTEDTTREEEDSTTTDNNEVEEDDSKKRAQSQIDRLKKERDEAKAELAKYKTGNKESNSDSNDALLARLENRGVLDPKEQEYVIKFAKVEGINPIDALNEEVVKDKLAFFKREREARASTFVAPNRTGTKVDEVDKWVARYKKDGSLPDGNPALISKILDKLK